MISNPDCHFSAVDLRIGSEIPFFSVIISATTNLLVNHNV